MCARTHSLDEIESNSQFQDLKAVWNGLLDKCLDRHIFLTWEYLSTYWKYFGRGKRLRILIAGANGKTLAIAPLRQTHYPILGSLSYDVIEPLAYAGADYAGFLMPQKAEDCCRSFLEYLVESGGWDFMHLYDLPQYSVIPQLLSHLRVSGPSCELVDTPNRTCPYISIPDRTSLLTNSLSGHFRNSVQRCMRKLQREHGKVELVDSSGFGSITNAMNNFFRLHRERWLSKNMPGYFSEQVRRDFHVDLAKSFAAKGWLALYFLTVDDDPVAVSYNYVYDNRMYSVLGGFDPEYSTYSVGNLLMARVLEECVRRRIREYDLMKGGESYKFEWAKTSRTNISVRFVNHRPISILYDRGIRVARTLGIERIVGGRLREW